ncbi:class II aldolase/adducin family protein [Curvivirga sp.]|uniref:class II aldolase/adducin family protein n=1 Tax=Curvivirga sp. TaxID=2856848 RepID=UPI003B59D62B
MNKTLNTDKISAEECQTRVELAACYRLIAHYSMDELIWNHISAKIPGTEEFLINPMGYMYHEITASNLVKVDIEGNTVGGLEDSPTNFTGFVIHSGIHKARHDLQCVLHTHSEGGLAVSSLEEGFVPTTQDGFMFHGRMKYHDYEGLSVDLDEQQRLAADLGEDGMEMILRNHGLLTCGQSIGEAFVRMYYLERACRVQMMLMASGKPVRDVPEEIKEKAYQQSWNCFNKNAPEWPALMRLVESRYADFNDL